MALVGFVTAEVSATEKGPQLPEPLGVKTEILPPTAESNNRPIIRVIADFPAPDDSEAEKNAKGTRIVYCRAKGVDLPLKDSEQRRMMANVNVFVQVPKPEGAAETSADEDEDEA
jgi:hypothetical protein